MTKRRPSETTAREAHEHKFVPKPAQLRYLASLEDAIANRQPVSDRSICRSLRMSRQTLYEWREDARFRVWLQEHLRSRNEGDYELMLRKHLQLAMAGSVKSAQLVVAARALEIRAQAAKDGHGGAGGGLGEPMAGDIASDYTVNVLVKADPKTGICIPNTPTVQLLVPRPPALDEPAEPPE